VSESQLQPDDPQQELMLLPGIKSAPFFALEAKGEFTGARLCKARPDTYKAIVVLLGQGVGVIRIGQLLGVSCNTVMAVRDRELPAVEQVKEHIARVAHSGALLASEGILERLNELMTDPIQRRCLDIKDLKDLAVVFGILTSNAQLLAGQPTARVEIAQATPAHSDFNAYIAQLKNCAPTHLGEETPGQKEEGQAAGQAAEPARQACPAAQATADPTEASSPGEPAATEGERARPGAQGDEPDPARDDTTNGPTID
jgi:hypothetical protein